MRRIKDNGENETLENCRSAYEKYSEKKKTRNNIKRYEIRLDENLKKIVSLIQNENWKPSKYKRKEVKEKKLRILGKAPIPDHVLEAATIYPYEQKLYDFVSWHCPALKPKQGTHGLLRMLRNDLYRHSQREMYYNLLMDIHHYYPLMDHTILKEKLSKIVKPGKLLRFFFKVIDSYLQGVPLGIKVSQFFGLLYLADFDRLAMRFFDIGKDPEKLAYWTKEYISIKITTASSPDDYLLLCRGPAYMAERFHNFVKAGLPHYYRFVDNIIIIHEDKAVLQIFKTLTLMILSRDYHATINGDYNVRPTWMGIRIVGYVFYHEHLMLAKNNKQNLCRHVHKLFKKGLDEEQVRKAQASRFGYAKHADTIHLIKSIGMEKTLGKIIRNHRVKPPFDGMDSRQKVKFSSICKMIFEENRGGVEWDKKILLEDYDISDSKIEKTQMKVTIPDANGRLQDIMKEVPGKVLALRFKKIIKTVETKLENGKTTETYEFEKEKDKDGNPTLIDAEFYAFTGSKILIDQAMNDFTKEDLPSPTVIQQIKGKTGQTFFKFT